MKKINKVFILLLFMVTLGACGKAEETTVYENKDNPGVESIITFYHKGDKVTKQTTTNILNYEKSGLENKENAKLSMEAVGANGYKDVKGIDYSTEYKEDELIEKVTINYDKLDSDAAKDLPGVNMSGNVKNGVSLKESEKLVETSGYTKK